MLAAALLMAMVAALVTLNYVNGADKRANADAALVKVFRVKKDVAKGLPGEQAVGKGFVVADVIPEKYRPSTAITDASAIRSKVALTNLSAGQVLVEGQFVDPKLATVSFAQRIPAGQVAITVQVDQIRGVANLIVPGDKVNLLVNSKEGQRTLLQNVNVIAVGATVAPQAGEAAPQAPAQPGAAPQGTGLITFAVPPAAAEKIAFASSDSEKSGLYLTLVPPENPAVQIPVINNDNLFQGGLTPYAP